MPGAIGAIVQHCISLGFIEQKQKASFVLTF
jgi:hypothetical protein